MYVLLAGPHGRLGSRILALLLHRGHRVRGLGRTKGQAEALRELGADAVVADLRGDVEWTAEGRAATIFAAGARDGPRGHAAARRPRARGTEPRRRRAGDRRGARAAAPRAPGRAPGRGRPHG